MQARYEYVALPSHIVEEMRQVKREIGIPITQQMQRAWAAYRSNYIRNLAR